MCGARFGRFYYLIIAQSEEGLRGAVCLCVLWAAGTVANLPVRVGKGYVFFRPGFHSHRAGVSRCIKQHGMPLTHHLRVWHTCVACM